MCSKWGGVGPAQYSGRLVMKLVFKLSWALRFLFYRLILGFSGGVDSYIGRPIFLSGVKNRIKIDGSLGIFPGARIEIFEQGSLVIRGKVRIGQDLHCIIGNDVIIGDGVVISSGVYISSYESIHKRFDMPINSRPVRMGVVTIGKNVFIGKGVSIFPGVCIGDNAVIGMNTIVKKNVKGNTVFYG